MSKKKSAIDRAVESLEQEVAVLQAAIAKLRQQAAKAPVRKPNRVPSIKIGSGSVSALNIPGSNLT